MAQDIDNATLHDLRCITGEAELREYLSNLVTLVVEILPEHCICHEIHVS